MICFKNPANNKITLVRVCLCAPGDDDVPAAVHPAVHLAKGGVAVQ